MANIGHIGGLQQKCAYIGVCSKKKWLRPFLRPKNTSIFFPFFCVSGPISCGEFTFFFLFYPKDKKKSAKRWGPSTHHPRINRVFFVYLRPSGNNPKKDQKGDPQGDPLRQVLLRGINRVFFVYLRPSGNNPKKDQKGDPQGDPLRQVLLRGIKRISTTVKCISSKNFYYSL